jgi:hypothetical protein
VRRQRPQPAGAAPGDEVEPGGGKGASDQAAGPKHARKRRRIPAAPAVVKRRSWVRRA